MAYYEGTYLCGHDGEINIIGSSKERAWRRERAFNNLCPECYKKILSEERQRKNKESDAKSAEMGLPRLTGSKKQVEWATTLRINVIELYESRLIKFEEKNEQAKRYFKERRGEENQGQNFPTDIKISVCGKNGEKVYTSREELSDAMDYILKHKTDSKFWIDNRGQSNIFGLFIEIYREYMTETYIPDDVKQEINDLKERLTVVPETEISKGGIVEMEYRKDNRVLSVKYIKDEGFIEIVKSLNYYWDGETWNKKISEYTGKIDERSAELGYKLLSAGYTVRFQNEKAKTAAISGVVVPENDRWIKYNPDESKLSISWRVRSDVLYKNARKLPGAQWKNGHMLVKIEFYKEIEDFAETMGFSISQSAKRKLEEFKQKERGFVTAKVSAENKKSVSDEERIEKSLKSDGTIIKDLIDQ